MERMYYWGERLGYLCVGQNGIDVVVGHGDGDGDNLEEDALDLAKKTPREYTPQITCAGNAGVSVIDRPRIYYRVRCSCTPSFLVYCVHTLSRGVLQTTS